MIKVTNIEQVNGIPYVKAKVVFINMGDTKTGDYKNSQIHQIVTLDPPEGKWSKIILISDAEDFEPGDKYFFDGKVDTKRVADGAIYKGGKKLLADSMNISPASLELIRAGVIKENDEILIECEKVPVINQEIDKTWNLGVTPSYQIRQDENGHVIIHQQESKEKPGLYTKAVVRKVAYESWSLSNKNDEDFNDWITDRLK